MTGLDAGAWAGGWPDDIPAVASQRTRCDDQNAQATDARLIEVDEVAHALPAMACTI
jgi:hypothetical protein